jgi:hypothetical protein
VEPCPIIHEDNSVTDQVKRRTNELFFSKQALFLIFQIAQQIAAKPAIWVLRLVGTNCGNHQKNCEKLPGRVGELMAVATVHSRRI